jgi:hypothetical protein
LSWLPLRFKLTKVVDMFLFVLNEFINKEAPFGVIPQCAKFIASKP